jgi:outer membrane protein
MDCLPLRLDSRPATKHLRKVGLLLLVVSIALVPVAGAQEPPADGGRPLAAVIDDYVREGLQSNLSLRAQSLEVERSVAALDEARARYFPEAGFEARYTWAEGGRTFEIPLGQALNPAYQTLNDLLVAQGQQPQFPVVQDETIAFLREREQDTRITLRMPLLQPAIPAAVRAQRELLGASEYAHVALGRRLKRDITVGYLQWLATVRNRGIVDASVALLNENLRVNDSLFRNGKITQDQVLRARAELLEVTQQSREAENAAAQSRSYLNFLLNRPLDTALENVEVGAEVAARTMALADLRSAALANRPELAELAHLTRASEAQVQVAKAERWPTLSLGADGGTQGEEYEFGRGSNYATVSLLLNWTFFDGGARRAGVRQASAAARRTATQLGELTQQVQLEVQQSLDRLNTSADSLATADARSEAARAAFRIASRKRDEGAISQVEFIDARESLTRAELNLNVTRFSVLARQAELDYATASGSLPLSGVAN